MNSRNSESGKKYEFGAYFKYEDLNKELIKLMTVLSSDRIGDKGIFFQKHEKRNSSLFIGIPKIHIKKNSNNLLNSSSTRNINLFSLRKKNKLNSLRKINSDMKLSLYLPSISNSNIKDDSFNNSIPKRKGYKLNTEKKNIKTHKLFQNESSSFNQTQTQTQTVMKNSFNNLDFLNNNSKYFQQFFYNENDYAKRLQSYKKKKCGNLFKKKASSVLKSFNCLTERKNYNLRKKIEISEMNIL